MNRADLIEDVNLELGGNRNGRAQEAVRAVVDAVTKALRRGDEVRLTGFGNFTVKDVPEHAGTNPRTGEIITIAARRRVKFTAAKALLG